MLKHDLAKADLQQALAIVNERINDEEDPNFSNFFERALLEAQLGGSKTAILCDVRAAMKKDVGVVDLARFIFQLKDLKKLQLAKDVVNQIKHDRPELAKLAEKWNEEARKFE
ncbi:MAG: hypothetical protein SGJ27_18610 [Candidatus Melainabacteria bacterium]|nr:hypothetical protein [Candidatus Melainabacteria bacterium]